MKLSSIIPGQNLPAEIFNVVMGLACLIDLIIVELGYTSISMETWIQTELHPTLIAAGILATVGICYLLRKSGWGHVMFMGLMGGHLFVHW